jgi:hypothetical protein
MTMKAKDIFRLAVRVLGLFFIYLGLSATPTVLPMLWSRSAPNAIVGALMVLWPLVVAKWLLGGAPMLMRIAYPDSGRPDESGTAFAGTREGKPVH